MYRLSFNTAFLISVVAVICLCVNHNLDNPIDPNGSKQYLPSVYTMDDDSVNINDTIEITATGTDSNGAVVKYVWALDGKDYSDTTDTGLIATAFPDRGVYNVTVKVIDDYGLISEPDSVKITVTLDSPKVTAMNNAFVNINDTIEITATGTDNNTVVKYFWAIDSENFSYTTDTGLMKTAFPDSGIYNVKVKVIDDDSIFSQVDEVYITVTLDAPILIAVKDTFVSRNDTVTINVIAIDPNSSGYIKKYYWNMGGNGWDDSTESPEYSFTKSDGGTVEVIWGATDDDGIMRTDTFEIVFNTPPVSVTMIEPADGDTAMWLWVDFDYSTGKGSVKLNFSGSDSDLPDDTLSYTLLFGNEPSDLTHIYTGKNTACTVENLDTLETYYWRLKAVDSYGDSVTETGSFFTNTHPPPPAGMKLITSTDSSFPMGSDNGDSDEKPIHTVQFSYHFWIDTTEVTQGSYDTLMTAAYSGYSLPSWNDFGTGSNYPAYNISWYEAVLYCNARSKQESLDTVYSYHSIVDTTEDEFGLTELSIDLSKRGYRLPTEAEWEYACRAGTTTEYYWGDSIDSNHAWYSSNSNASTHPVAQKPPNDFGLYDMSGNVWEWCNDWHGSNYYSTSPEIDPEGPSNGAYRILRGGSWGHSANGLRSASRGGVAPELELNVSGFRCVVRITN